MPADWAAETIAVDGTTTDWDGITTRYFQEQGAVVGAANDSSNLFLLVRFRDPKWVGMIKMTGLRLSFKTDSRDNSPFTLTYRGGPSGEELRKLSGDRGGGEFGDNRDRSEMPGGDIPGGGPMISRSIGGDQREFTCAIEGRIEEKAIPVDGSEGPKAAFSAERGLFSYEFSIPFDKGGIRLYGLGLTPGGDLKVDVTWGDAIQMTTPGGRSGGPPGGGMGGGPPGGMMRGDMPQKQEVTFEIDLAAGPVDKAQAGD